MVRTIVAAGLVLLLATPVLANPCGFEEQGRMVVVGYAVGATAVPADQRAKLAKFAATAKFRDEICVFAQVDKQGSEAANIRVANGRAGAVRRFLLAKGVRADTITLGKQEKAFTLFSLLSSDQPSTRSISSPTSAMRSRHRWVWQWWAVGLAVVGSGCIDRGGGVSGIGLRWKYPKYF